MMKKLFVFLLPVLLLFSACGDDKEEWTDLNSHPIVGAWEVVSLTPEVEANDALKDIILAAIESEIPMPKGALLSFQKDGVLTTNYNGDTDDIDYKIKGSTLVLSLGDEYGDINAVYSIKEDQLTISADLLEQINQLYLGGYGSMLPEGYKIQKVKVNIVAKRSQNKAN